MCGIALIIGPNPSPMVFDSMLDAIAPRGEARETLRACPETGPVADDRI